MASLSRGFIVNRAFAADRWLQQRFGRSLLEAQESDLRAFLDEQPHDVRMRTLDALVAYGDDRVRKGQAWSNPARVIRLPD